MSVVDDVLEVLGEHEEGLAFTELQHETGIGATSLQQALDRLVKEELVVTTDDGFWHKATDSSKALVAAEAEARGEGDEDAGDDVHEEAEPAGEHAIEGPDDETEPEDEERVRLLADLDPEDTYLVIDPELGTRFVTGGAADSEEDAFDLVMAERYPEVPRGGLSGRAVKVADLPSFKVNRKIERDVPDEEPPTEVLETPADG